MEAHLDAGRLADHVVVGEDVAIRPEDDAGSSPTHDLIAAETEGRRTRLADLHADGYDARGGSLRDGGEGVAELLSEGEPALGRGGLGERGGRAERE